MAVFDFDNVHKVDENVGVNSSTKEILKRKIESRRKVNVVPPKKRRHLDYDR